MVVVFVSLCVWVLGSPYCYLTLALLVLSPLPHSKLGLPFLSLSLSHSVSLSLSASVLSSGKGDVNLRTISPIGCLGFEFL